MFYAIGTKLYIEESLFPYTLRVDKIVDGVEEAWAELSVMMEKFIDDRGIDPSLFSSNEKCDDGIWCFGIFGIGDILFYIEEVEVYGSHNHDSYIMQKFCYPPDTDDNEVRPEIIGVIYGKEHAVNALRDIFYTDIVCNRWTDNYPELFRDNNRAIEVNEMDISIDSIPELGTVLYTISPIAVQ